MVIKSFVMAAENAHCEIEVPSRVDGKRRYLAQVSEACRVSRHKLTHECKILPTSIHE